MVYCTQCGHQNKRDGEHPLRCAQCGALLPQVCAACGQTVPPESRFCNHCGAGLIQDRNPHAQIEQALKSLLPAKLAAKMDAAATRMAGERREVTVLFVSLSGLSGASRALDREQAYLIMDQAMCALAEVVYQYEGTVDRYTGEGLMALFGLPIAHENDAERAVRAALDMQRALRPLKASVREAFGSRLYAQAGIHTGQVIAGQLSTSRHVEYTVVGDTVTLAQRLLGAAEPDTVAVSFDVYQRTRPLFWYQGLAAVESGKESVQAFRPVQTRDRPGQTRGLPGMEAPMFGRAPALQTLQHTLERVLSGGQGQIVLVTGEAGVGKSRLLAEFRQTLNEAQVQVYQGGCSSYSRTKPLQLVVNLVRNMLYLVESELIDTQCGVVQSFVQRLGLSTQDVLPYLYNVLGLARYDPAVEARLGQLDDAVLQNLTHAALQQVLVAQARLGPTVLVFEDLHWVDPASRDFLVYLIQALGSAPLMVVLVSRETERQTVIGPLVAAAEKRAEPMVDLRLEPLSPQDCAQLVDRLVPANTADARALKARIVERVDGNPFYAEEVVRVLVDHGGLRQEGGSWRLMPDARELVERVPGTLNGLIMARFDGLPPRLRRTLQCASVLGASFPERLLEALAEPGQEAAADLSQLESRQFLLAMRSVIEQRYTFRHALVQEAVYSTLLRRDRRRIHTLAAVAIERGQYYAPDEQTESLAYHYAESETPVEAAPYLIAAAELASRRSAYESAIAYYRRGLDLLQPTSPNEELERLDACIGLGRALRFTGDLEQASEVVDEALANLVQLSLKLDSIELVPSTVRGLIEMAEIEALQGVPEQAIVHLEAGQDTLDRGGPDKYPDLWAALLERMAWVRFRQGKLDEAQALASSAVFGMDRQGQDDPLRLASLYNTLGGVSWQQGNLPQAIGYVERSLHLYEQLNYAWGMANAHTNLGVLHYSRGSWPAAIASLEQAEALQRQNGDLQNQAISLNNLGTLRQSRGEHEVARCHLADSLAIRERLGDAWGVAQSHVSLAQLDAIEYRFDEAMAHVEKALSAPEALGGYAIEARWIKALCQADADLQAGLQSAARALEMARAAGSGEQEADCRRALGTLRARAGDYLEAESLLREASELCIQQNAPYGQGLALLELGRLYQRMARTDDLNRDVLCSRAISTLQHAVEILERLGAEHDLRQAQAAIRQLQRQAQAQQGASALAVSPTMLDLDHEYRNAAIVSVRLGPTLDADEEAVFEVMSSVLPELIEIAENQRGYVMRRPDGLTVVLGAPTAFEDDVERAVETAREMNDRLSGLLARGYPLLDVGIGVSSGNVIAGEMSSSLRPDYMVRGPAVQEARAVAEAATLGMVWVTESVRTQSSRVFVYRAVPGQDVAGMPIWELAGRRVQPAPSRGLPGLKARLIGREQPLRAMANLAQNLKQGIGGLVWIEGEPGIGKSRLMDEFVSLVAESDALVWRARCVPQRSQHAFSLFADMLSQAVGVQPTDDVARIGERLSRVLIEWPRNARVTQPYIEMLLGVQPGGGHNERLARLEPEQLRQQTFVSIRRLLQSLARQQAIVLFFDDLHWIDPISAELMQFLLTLVASAPVLFVCAQRRQGADKPNDRLVRLQSLIPTQTARLALSRLTADESEALLNELLPGAELTPELRGSILGQSEGNPYFIEEFVRMLIEQGWLRYDEDRWALDDTRVEERVDLPSSLETLIRSRIDALPDELRQLVQHASIIGAPFDASLLALLLERPSVRADLQRLESRLLVQRGSEADEWRFNHSLIEGVAYNSMLQVTRRDLHRRVAEALEARWAGNETEHAPVLAYHLARADQDAKALTYLMMAGERAAAQSATEEAIGYFEQAAERLSVLPDTPDDLRWRLAAGLGDVYRAMARYADSASALKAGLSLMETSDLSDDVAVGLYRRLGETARKQGDLEVGRRYFNRALRILGTPHAKHEHTEAARCLGGLAWIHYVQGQPEEALETGRASVEHAQSVNALAELAFAENLLGGIYFWKRDWSMAMHHTRRAMVLREQMGYTWGVCSILSNLGILAAMNGEWTRARFFFERSLGLRQELGDVEGVAIAHHNLGSLARDQGELDRAEQHFRDNLAVTTPFEMASHGLNSAVGLAQVHYLRGDLQQALDAVREAQRQAEEIGAQDPLIDACQLHAQALLALGQLEEAQAQAERAEALSDEVGNHGAQAGAWRVMSQIALRRDDPAGAREALSRAQEVMAEATDELESGRIAAQSGVLWLHEGAFEQAQADLQASQKIFARLGARIDLEKVEALLRQPTTRRREQG